MHLCRGNQASRWLVEGGYDWLAERLFSRVDADRLLLEYDDERSGSFEPLEEVPEDKIAVLGLVTTKSGRGRPSTSSWRASREAARVLPLERLALSPQCGFATSVLGNALTVEEERESSPRSRRRPRACGDDRRSHGDEPHARRGAPRGTSRRAGRARAHRRSSACAPRARSWSGRSPAAKRSTGSRRASARASCSRIEGDPAGFNRRLDRGHLIGQGPPRPQTSCARCC